MGTAWEGEGGTTGERSTEHIYDRKCNWPGRVPVNICWRTQGAQSGALCKPQGARWGGREFKEGGDIYTPMADLR